MCLHFCLLEVVLLQQLRGVSTHKEREKGVRLLFFSERHVRPGSIQRLGVSTCVGVDQYLDEECPGLYSDSHRNGKAWLSKIRFLNIQKEKTPNMMSFLNMSCYAIFYFSGTKSSETELIQYLNPVGLGPSSKICPK